MRNRIVAHAGEEVVGIVVFAHMLEAELPVFGCAQPAFWRTMRCRRFAARPFASRKFRACATVLIGLDPDSIEQRRIRTHRHDYAVVSLKASRLDRIKTEHRGD
ncbi:MAG: hypothetical protein WB868_00315 [Xanthobacteraceae bacterium]